MQLMLLEQQNKKRLAMARQELDAPAFPGGTAGLGQMAGLDWMAGTKGMPGSSTMEGSSIGDAVMTNGSDTGCTGHSSETDLLNLLDNDMSNMGSEELQNYLQGLQARAKQLKTMQEKKEPAFRYQTLYRILQEQEILQKKGQTKFEKTLSLPFLDPPERIYGGGKSQSLRCKVPVENFELFLEQNKDVSFIVYQTYTSNSQDPMATDRLSNGHNQSLDIPPHVEESIRPVAQGLIEALETILESREEYAQMLQNFRGTLELHAPYIFMYHHRSDLENLIGELKQQSKEQFTLFSNYVVQQHGSTYASADSMISQGKISPAYIDYLFKPGDVLISRHKSGYRGYVASSWASKTYTTRVPRSAADANKKGVPMGLYGSNAASRGMANDTVLVHDFNIQTWFWDFDGDFRRGYELLKFSIQTEEKKTKFGKNSKSRDYEKIADETDPVKDVGVSIAKLKVFPVKFASPETFEQLRKRGKTFWQCRVRRYVSYREQEADNVQSVVSLRQIP